MPSSKQALRAMCFVPFCLTLNEEMPTYISEPLQANRAFKSLVNGKMAARERDKAVQGGSITKAYQEMASGLTVSASDPGLKGTGFESRSQLILSTIYLWGLWQAL